MSRAVGDEPRETPAPATDLEDALAVQVDGRRDRLGLGAITVT
jgi:hypothetical protein